MKIRENLDVVLDGNEIAQAIDAFLTANGVYAGPARTILLCQDGEDFAIVRGFRARVVAENVHLNGQAEIEVFT